MQKIRNIVIQATLLVAILISGYLAYRNLLMHFGDLGVAFDISFLFKKSNLDLTQTWLLTTPEDSNTWLFFVSILNTISMALCCIVLTSLLSLVLAFLSYHPNPLIAKSIVVYVEIFRNIPLLLQIIFWFNAYVRIFPLIRNSISFAGVVINNRGIFLPYYHVSSGVLLFACICVACYVVWAFYRSAPRKRTLASRLLALWVVCVIAYCVLFETLQIPTLTRFSIRNAFQIYPEFIGCALGLIFYTSSYVTESIRGCLNAAPKGQFEAARALGFSEFFLYRKIILPQVMPAIVPQLASHYMNITKNTSLGIGIGYPEMFGIFAGTVLNQSGRAIEIIAMVMIVYLLLSFIIAQLMQWVNNRYEPWTGVKQR